MRTGTGECDPFPGDCNNDHILDAIDLSCMSQNWLQTTCSAPSWCDKSDMNHSTKVDMADFAMLSMRWLVVEE